MGNQCVAAVILVLCTVTCTGNAQSVEQVHVTLGATPEKMTVAFATMETDITNGTAGCNYGASNLSMTQRAVATMSTYTEGGWLGRLFSCSLNVAPSAMVYYQCDYQSQGNHRMGNIYSFTATPASPSYPLVIAAVADLGSNCPMPGCGDDTIEALSNGAKSGDYDVLVHAGDIAYTSGNQSIWDDFMNEMEPIAARIPYLTCVGNHEHYFNFSGYLHRFQMPGENGEFNNLYYGVDYGPVHFLAISSEHNYTVGSPQYDFIVRDLKKAAANRHNVPWIVAYGHRPLYCSTDDYYDCEMNSVRYLRPILEPLFDEYDVDLFLAGHLHNYERMFQVLNGTLVSQSYDNATTTFHAVIGMAGDNEGLTDSWMNPSPEWSAVRKAALGYSRLTFESPTSMTFQYVMTNSTTTTIADQITLTKHR